MKRHMHLLVTATLTFSITVGFGADNDSVFTKQARVIAADLQRRVSCALKGDIGYCKLEYRGLFVEFADPENRKGRALYIHAMGKNQVVSSFGTRCLEVLFSDPDLRVPGGGTPVLLRDDAKILVNEGYQKTIKACT